MGHLVFHLRDLRNLSDIEPLSQITQPAAAAEAAAVPAVDVAGEPPIRQQHEGLAQWQSEGRPR